MPDKIIIPLDNLKYIFKMYTYKLLSEIFLNSLDFILYMYASVFLYIIKALYVYQLMHFINICNSLMFLFLFFKNLTVDVFIKYFVSV